MTNVYECSISLTITLHLAALVSNLPPETHTASIRFYTMSHLSRRNWQTQVALRSQIIQPLSMKSRHLPLPTTTQRTPRQALPLPARLQDLTLGCSIPTKAANEADTPVLTSMTTTRSTIPTGEANDSTPSSHYNSDEANRVRTNFPGGFNRGT